MKQAKLRAAAAAAMLAAAVGAQAQIPATAPYNTDVANLYVQDETSQGIGSLNMVLCVIGSMDPGDMVNAGPYLALVDMNKCQTQKGGSSNSGSATNFANAIVDVTRASNSDPMVAKVWLSLSEQGGTTNVYAHLSATQSPTDAPPYGAFRMDYIGKQNGQTGFNGYIVAQPGSITFLETGQQSSNTALAMSANATTSGAGTMQIGGGNSGQPQSTFNFAYDPSYFHRDDGTNDECFDRSKANASTLVWQYGTYNANDGTRVDQAHPGIPVLATYQGTSYYGFANYWGINFNGLSIPDGQPVSGLTVADQRPNNTTTYQLNKVGGKLTKWTQAQTTLGALVGIPVNVNADLASLTSASPTVSGVTQSGWNNWVIQWTGSLFQVVGVQACGSNGCSTSNFDAAVNADMLTATTPLSGWANSFGGNMNIPPTGSAHTSSDPVFYFNQTTVIPGSASLSLICLSQCPTYTQLQGYSQSTQSTPFANGTDQQWNSALTSANTVSYTFGASGLSDGSGLDILESGYPNGSQYAQNGIQTGWLFDAGDAFSPGNCPNGSPSGMVCQDPNPSTYYTWQTGSQQWNQSLWLTNNGSVVPFDPPQNINYTVPTGSQYGSYAGLPILLQFNGFGNLSGIPGYCVNPVNNAPVDCSTNGSQYVPMFSIPDGTTMTLPDISGSGTTPLIVKALNGEILLKQLSGGQCASMTLTAQTLPTGGLHDPSNSSDSEYLGTEPVVTSAPKVVDGVVQQ
jgi:hypothetical protein